MLFFKSFSPERRFFLIVSVFGIVLLIALQIVLSLHLPFAEDEVYYWYWSKYFSWSYPEHPPMIAFFFRLVSELLGAFSFAYRFFFLFLFLLLSIVLYFFGKYLTGERWSGFLFVIIFYFTPNFLGTTLVVTTDTPMIFFLFIALFFYTRAFFPVSSSSELPLEISEKKPNFLARHIHSQKTNYIVAGIFIGFATLSKLTSFIVVGAIVLYTIFSRRRKDYWSNPYFYLSFVIMLVIFMPCLLWNVQNDFVLLKQLNFMTTKKTSWFYFRIFYQNQVFLSGPFFFMLIPLLSIHFFFRYYRITICRIFNRSYKLQKTYPFEEKSFFFAFIVFVEMMYLLVKSFFHILHPNWSLFILICFCPLAVIYVSQIKKRFFYYFLSFSHLFVTLCISLAVFLIIYFFSISSFIIKNYPDTMGRIFTFYKYEVFEGDFKKYYKEKMDKDLLIAGNNYQIPSFVNYHWKPDVPAVNIRIYDYHYTIFDVFSNIDSYRGQDIYYIFLKEKKFSIKGLSEICGRTEKLETFSSKIHNEDISYFDLYKCYDFQGSPYGPFLGEPGIISWMLSRFSR